MTFRKMIFREEEMLKKSESVKYEDVWVYSHDCGEYFPMRKFADGTHYWLSIAEAPEKTAENTLPIHW